MIGFSILLPLFKRRDLDTSQSVCRDKNVSHYICYGNIVKYSIVKRKTGQIDHRPTGLNKMLINKSVLNEIKKVGRFTQGFKD